MTLYPMDLADEVYRSKPSNVFEAADFLQSYLDSHPWRKKNINKCKEVSGLGEGCGESGGDPGRTGYSMEYQGKKGNNSKDGRYESRDIDDKGSKQDWEKTITCFGCGVKGHRKSECPEKVWEKSHLWMQTLPHELRNTSLSTNRTHICQSPLSSSTNRTHY